MRKVILLILIMVLGGVVSVGLGTANSYLKATNASGALEGVEIKIAKGEGIDEIARNLKEKELIKSEVIFKIYALLSGNGQRFKPGNYELSSRQSAISLVESLVAGPPTVKAIIIPGMTLKEIDALLSGLKIVPKGSITTFNIDLIRNRYAYLKHVNSLEGFLLPDTYDFFYDSDPKTVVTKILDNFDEKVVHNLNLQDVASRGNINWLVLASILEKEVIERRDAQIVSGILQKRIEDGMRLQVDASVIYAVCGGRFIGCPSLKKSDFDNMSLYNTYRHKGYPPGPISNPGLSSIEAALNPIKTSYWFYLSEPRNKTTIFSSTFDEHVANKIKYMGR